MWIKNKCKTLNSFMAYKAPCLILLTIIIASCKSESHYPGPLSPEESMKTFHFAENFKTEIFAAEPLITDPVFMEFDEEGNIYVVVMPDANQPYIEKGECQILLLKDINGDGRADTSIVFADTIIDATSILPWNGGIIITAAPNIMYYKDTDGDDHADLKEILFTGFFNNHDEGQITSLRFGIDNWIYANNVGRPGEVTYIRKPEMTKLNMEGSDFRFRLDRDQFELATGQGQFGQTIDDWGHRYFTGNSVPITQVIIPKRYLLRNPYLPTSAKFSIKNISDHDPEMFQLSKTPYWRQIRTDRRNEEFQKNNLDRVEYARDRFTGASGSTFYGGDKFPSEYYGNIFTGEVAGNLIHRDILSEVDGDPFMVAKRGEKVKEFMSSTDLWFRPVNFSVDPAGYLYVLDMYRQHIEGPKFVPDDLRQEMDYKAGNKYGRIYRIAPGDDGPYKSVNPELKDATSSNLVNALTYENRWWRLTSQRLLLERQDKSVLSEVRDLFNKNKDPRFRLHALYVLEGMNALDVAIIETSLKDPSPGVRENGVILSERFPGCLSQLAEMVNDSSNRVAFQATLSLGQFQDNLAVQALAKSLEIHGQNMWFRTAVLSSEAGSGIDLLKNLDKNLFFKDTTSWKPTFFETFSNIIGARNDKHQILELLDILMHSSILNAVGLQVASIKGLIKGLENQDGSDVALKEHLKNISSEVESNTVKAIQELKGLYGK